jgi:hypothetical protein
MKQIITLPGILAVVAFSLPCAVVSTANAANGPSEIDANGVANVVFADTSSALSGDGIYLAMGEDDGAMVGGNAPNPEPDRSVATTAEDAAITAKVKSKFLADTTVGGLKIDIDTRNGVVYLTGDNMNSQTEIDMAIQIAKGTEGVKDVVPDLTVVDVDE